MHDSNQGPGAWEFPASRAEAAPAAAGSAVEDGLPPAPLPEIPLSDTPAARGLLAWLGIVLVSFLAGILTGSSELGLMAVLAAMFAVAQAVDHDRRWLVLHHFLRWITPAMGAAGFAGLAGWLATTLPSGRERDLAVGVSALAALLVALTAWPWFANRLVALLFGGRAGSHTLRLAARIALLGFACAWPVSVAFGWMLEQGMVDTTLLGSHSFVGSLFGFILLSFGAVGLFVSRGFRESLDRLGLRGMGFRDVLWAGFGLVALLGLNAAFEWVSRTWFPAAAAHDLQVTQLIAGELTRTETLLLGISAGVGEELSMRGALQPRLGLLTTALLFGALHVQYSWIGILTIVLIGTLLGLVRRRTSTTVVIAIHVLYDILAVLATQQSG